MTLAYEQRKKTAVDDYTAEVHEIGLNPTSSVDSAIDLSEIGDDEPPRKRNKSAATGLNRVEWSEDDSANNGEQVYKKFAARKSMARGKAVRLGRKAKAVEADQNPAPRRQDRTGVGRQNVKSKARVSKTTEKVNENLSSDDDLMECTVPDYLRERRTKFDERMEHLKQGGLKLPPTYDDVYFSDDERLENLKERPDFPNLEPCAPYIDIPLPYSLGLIPAPIAQWLREYQVRGAEFLHELFVYQKGGLLGDDMGLGKTVQVIAFLSAAYGKTGDERDGKRMRKMRRSKVYEGWYPRTLIVCPGGLMSNWLDEFNRWGWWHVDIYHGATAAKEAALVAAQAGHTEIMITTYHTYRASKAAINLIPWDCVVADECHQIKERISETAQAMNEVNCLCRIGLTGTPLQNKYEELWTLLNWTNPGRFGPVSTWKASICEPLKQGQSHNATVYELSRARKTAKKLVENLLPRFFLRRMKTVIKDQLPKKSDRVVFCPLTPTQAMAYENFLDSDIVQCIKHSGDMCSCNSGKKAGWCCHMYVDDGETKWQNWVFPAIQNLQKISNHLAILIPQSSDMHEKQAKDLEMLRIALPDMWKDLYRERDSILNYANVDFCGKWKIMKKLLKYWNDEGGNKVLVFSHSVRLLKMLRMLFNHTSYTVSYLDGSMKYEDRYAAVSDFNHDPSQFVFLISTRAGGVGLNITSANKVIVVDPNWNPSYDLQAQDRAYRIGQTRDVEVFRLVSQGTLEEIVYARQIYKQQQANIGYNASSERRYFQGVQDRQDQKGEIFGLSNLFAYQDDNVVLRDIVNKTNIAESRADVKITDLELAESDAEEDEREEVKADDEGDPLSQSIKIVPDSEDAAMSQLAAMIIQDVKKPRRKKGFSDGISTSSSGKAKKHNPVQAILSSAGVQYTHENSEVIGSSKVEAQLSKRAESAAENGATREQDVRIFDEESQSQDTPRNVNTTSAIRYRYRPPEDVRKRQFCNMAKWARYSDAVEFGLLVEGWTQAQRRDCLRNFYKHRKTVLGGGRDGAVDSEDDYLGEKDTKDESKQGVELEGDDDDDEL